MSQYAARDGFAHDWHLVHLGRFALGGCGLVFAEATAVSPEGRRTHGDLGLWNGRQVEPLRRVVDFIRQQGAAAGIQLGHAGRKASERRPWHGEVPVDAEDVALRGEHPWQALGPTTQRYADNWHSVKAMSVADIDAVIEAFGAAAGRAHEAGFDVLEVYAAHGFLLHQFYSPLSNSRDDDWGGDFERRTRICVEVARSIRKRWPDEKPLFFRISGTDWLEDGWEIADSVRLAGLLKEAGVDLIDCSSGGLGGPYPAPRFPLGPAFQAHIAEAIRREVDMPTMSVGLIWQSDVANRLIADGKSDLVALARELLNDPNWALKAAAELGVDSDHSLWDPAFGWWLNKRQRLFSKLGIGG